MKIAVLAWGSLVWDQGQLEVGSPFAPDGPHLPIEFCRVSGQNAAPRRLTLVIDEAIGADCLTYSAQSGLDNLDLALTNLWMREGSEGEKHPKKIRKSGRVAFVDLTTGTESETAVLLHPAAVQTIRAWAKAKTYDAVIWTALGSNFGEPATAGKAFSVEAAVRFLEGRSDDQREVALTYIRNAPPEVKTPVRDAVTARWPQG